ncbi:hypothetical protein DPM19_09490 [Actinomadura craniellae]|uniref:Laminin G domain-containing protein n=1 Tax=Actinomadura craniellae TaxID=2231787 RepID=A0A365HAB5_9ACTN|nr:DNRLRE domain-containing protein [Actinomadura craniellae]RAY15969.1 hypothetical protein DPM19_09490 [Actinomadura craniellae]
MRSESRDTESGRPAGRLLAGWRGRRAASAALVVVVTVGLLPAALFETARAQAQSRPDTPDQRAGSAANRSHTAGARQTDAGTGTERTPGATPGALPLEKNRPTGSLPEPQAPIKQIGRPGEPPAKVRAALAGQTDGPRGFDPKTSTELPGRRGPDSQVFRNPDGTETTRIHQGDVHFKDAQGNWQKIDMNLAADPSGRLRVKADDRRMSFAPRANDPVLGELPLDDRTSVRFGLAEGAAATGQVNGSSVRYADVRGGADITLTAQSGGIKEIITLASPDDPKVWHFPLHLVGDLTPVLAEAGHVEFRDSRGAVRAVIPEGWMADSAETDQTGEVEYRLVNVAGVPVLQVTLDEEWLNDPARVYPVQVDPSVVDGDSDTYVRTNAPGNRSGDVELRVGNIPSTTSLSASYLKFNNVAAQLQGSYVVDVRLGLYNIWSANCATTIPVNVHPVTQAWDSATLTAWPGASYGPSIASKVFAHGGTGCAPAWELIDLGDGGIDLVDQWADGGTNHGLSLRAAADAPGGKAFASANSANKPYLEITHTAFGATYETVGGLIASPTNGQAGEIKIRVANTGHYNWAATGNDEARLGVRMFNATTNTELDARALTQLPAALMVGNQTTVTARIPQVPPGQYYAVLDMYRPVDKRWFSSYGVRVESLLVESIDVGPRVTEVHPRNNAHVSSLTPQLHLRTQTVDSYPPGATHEYQFTVCGGTPEEPVDCTTSPWGANGWEAPAGELEWGETYFWQGTAREGGTAGPQTPPHYFTTAVEQPAVTHHLAGAAPDADRDVDPKVGNYTTTVTDAEVAAAGPPISVVRTYNSRDPRTGNVFGAGWSTRYDMRAVPDADGSGNVVVIYPDGQQVRFGRNPDGTYQPPAGRYATFVANPGGGWTLADKAQDSYVFDAAGRLTELTDHRGRTQTLTYGTGGKLQTITAPGNRRLHFTWTGDHVTEVATDAPTAGAQPLRWTYTYSGDLLTEVCSPEDTPGACTEYTYQTGSHQRTIIDDTNPSSYWRLGESGGTAAASTVLSRGGTDNGIYNEVQLGVPGAVAGGTDTAARFNGTTSHVALPEGLVPENLAHFTIGLRFRTTATGGVLFSYDNRPVDSDAIANTYTPALYVGTDGKLRGQFWHGSIDPITSAQTVNDGNWHHALITAAGTTQTLYLDGVPVGTRTGNIVGYEQKYVALGAGTWTNWPATTGDRGFFNGDIDEVVVHDRPLGAPAIAGQIGAAQATARLTEVTLPSGRRDVLVTYDPGTERVIQYTDADGGSWKLSPPVLDQPDDGEEGAGVVTATVTVTDPRERASSFVLDLLRGSRVVSQRDPTGAGTGFTYDEGGFLAQITDENGNATRLGYDERGNQISRTTCRAENDCQTTHYAYHWNAADPLDPRNGQLVGERDPRSSGPTDDTYLTAYAYTAHGDLQSATTPPVAGFPGGRTTSHTYTDGTEPAVGGGTVPAGLPATTTEPGPRVTERKYTAAGDVAEVTHPNGLKLGYTYDALGRKLTETRTSTDHPAGLTVTFAYDGDSRITTETHPARTNAVNGQQHRPEIRHTYDADGNPLTEAVHDLLGGDPPRITSWTYDGHGRTLTETSPQGGTETYGWDDLGNRTRRTDPRGNVFDYAYSPRDQLIEVKLLGYTGGTATPGTPQDLVLDSYAYDPAGRLASHTDAMGRTIAYQYYDDGELADRTLTGFRNANGTTRDIVLEANTYNAAGDLTRQITGGGQVRTDLEVDAAGRTVAAVLDPGGLARRTELVYDGHDNVTRRTLSAAGTTRTEVVDMVYDVHDNLTRQTVRNGSQDLVTTFTYDQFGNPLTRTSPRGNAPGADPADHTTNYEYDPAGNLVKTKLPPVQVTQGGAPAVQRPEMVQGFNAFDDRTHVKDARGNIVNYTFDKDGRVVSTSLPSYTPPGGTQLVSTTDYGYDAAGNLLTQSDPLGRVTTHTYDQLGNLVKTVQPAVGGNSPVWRHGYTPLGERLWTENPLGARTEATYDDLGRPITGTEIERVPAPAAHTTTVGYDDDDNPVTVQLPGGGTETTEYNAAGEPTKVTDPQNRQTTFGYDLAGRQNRMTEPTGLVSRTLFDEAGRPTDQIDEKPAGTELRRRTVGYDPDDNPITQTDALNRVTQRTFDAGGRLTQLVEPVSGVASITTGFGYDADGNRTRLTDGRGNVTDYTFNPWGLIQSVVEPSTTAHPALSDRTYTMVYDAAGRPTEIRKPGGVTATRTFDNLDRLTEETGTGTGTTAPRTFGYDLAGRMTSASAPLGNNTFTWDDRGNLLSTAGPSGNATFAYDGRSRMTQRADTAGTTVFGWNNADDLTAVTDPLTGQSMTYGYGSGGELENVGYGAGAGTREFEYDDLGRLKADRLKAPGGTATASTTYGYDLEDRLTEKVTAGVAGAGTSTYTYDHAGRLTSWTSPAGALTSYEWDAAGNRTKAGTQVATYDERNRVLTAGPATYSWTPRGTLAARTEAGVVRNFSFDALDRMTGDGTTTFAYDALGRMVTRGTGSMVYAGLDNNPVSDGSTTFARDPFGEPLSKQTGGGTAASVLTNLHTDVTGTFDPDTGQVQSSTAYDPFGQPVATSGTGVSLGFQGEFTDPGTGLVNMHARWYSPELGAFISRDDYLLDPDPSVEANRYTYGSADPLVTTDPTGHWGFKKWTQRVLNAASYIPGPVGVVASVANAGIYAASGNWGAAAYAMAGAIPGGKILAKGLKAARSVAKSAKRYKPKPKAKPSYRPRYSPRPKIRYKPKYKPVKSVVRRASHSTGSRSVTRSTGRGGKAVSRGGSKSASGGGRVTPRAKPKPTLAQIIRNRAMTPAARPPLQKAAQNARNVLNKIQDTFTRAQEVLGRAQDAADMAADFGLALPTVPSVGEGLAGVVGFTPLQGATSCPIPPPDPGQGRGRRHSFVPGTQVLMADGTTKPIEQIKVGDKILAGDPNTDKNRAQTVTHLSTSKGTKHLVQITIDTDGKHGTKTGKLTATDNHPFWLPHESRWAEAADLKTGMWLRTSTGTWTQITALDHRTAKNQRVHNLTTTGDHTYHVVAGGDPILIHNDEPRPELCFPEHDTGKAAAHADGVFTLSGYSSDVPAGFLRPALRQVLRLQNLIGKDRVPFFMDNNAGDGAYYLSHAEKQAIVLRPRSEVTVTKPMCDDCFQFFIDLARATGRRHTVRDPSGPYHFDP